MMYGYNGWEGMMGFGPSGSLMMLIFWAAVIGIVVWIARGYQGSGTRSSALDILEERYARGEISRDEYLNKKKDLS